MPLPFGLGFWVHGRVWCAAVSRLGFSLAVSAVLFVLLFYSTWLLVHVPAIVPVYV